MYQIDLQWKDHPVDLEAVDTHLKELYEHYVGSSADTDLTLWFKEDHAADEDAIRAYWDTVTDAGYVPQKTVAAAMQAARDDALTRKWDDLSEPQKKLVMGLPVTRAELGL